MHADDDARRGDEHDVLRIGDQLHVDEPARLFVEHARLDALAAARLDAILRRVGALAVSVLGDGEDIVSLAQDEHIHRLVPLRKIDGAHAHRVAPHGADVGLAEADALAGAAGDDDLVPAARILDGDELVALDDADGDLAAAQDVRKLARRRLFDELEILPLKLELNSLGNLDERKAHREALIKYFEANQDVLDEDAKRRLYSNPLRILDTKNPDMQQMVEGAPKLLDYLKEDSLAFLRRMEELLSVAGVDYTINPRLVRGLDYYNHTVYEWVTDKLGAQATVCGGGRYDPLIEMLGGKPTPAVGFAMGVERVLEVMRECGFESGEPDTEVYVLHQGGASQGYAMMLGEILRDAYYEVIVHAGDASMKSQMKKADQSGAKYALICGEEETAHGQVTVKCMYGHEDERFMKQETLDLQDAIQYFVNLNDDFFEEDEE